MGARNQQLSLDAPQEIIPEEKCLAFRKWLRVYSSLSDSFAELDVRTIHSGWEAVQGDWFMKRPQFPKDCSVDFELVGAYKINPTCLKIVATGGSISMVVLVLAFSGLNIFKEAPASTCRQNWIEVVSKQQDVLKSSARQEVKLSPELARSSTDTIAISTSAAAMCGSYWRGLELKVQNSLPPGFEIRVGETVTSK